MKKQEKTLTKPVDQTSELLHIICNVHLELKSCHTAAVNAFLSCEENLREIQEDVSRLAGSTGKTLELISGEETETLLSHITETTDEISRAFDAVNTQINSHLTVLKSIDTAFGKVQDFRQVFNNVVSNLRMYSEATRTENARLNIAVENFHSLAVNVAELAEIIETKFSHFFERLEKLQTLIGNTINIINGLKKDHLRKVQESINNTLMNLVTLTGKQVETQQQAAAMSRQTTEIAGSLADIFHDLMRRKAPVSALCAAVETFAQLADALETVNSGGNSAGNAGSSADIAAEILAQCRLHSANLENTTLEAAASAADIRGALNLIAEKIAALELKGGEDSRIPDHSVFFGIGQDIARLIDLLMANVDNREALKKAIADVSGDISDFSGFISEIEEISLDLELIAVNARIKATQVGTNGAALAVIAEHIQRSSLDTQRHTAALLNILRHATAIGGCLQDPLADEASETLLPQQLLLQLNSELQSFRTLQQNLDDLFAEISATARKINAAITALPLSDGSQGSPDQFFESAGQALQRLSAQVGIMQPQASHYPQKQAENCG